MENKETESKAVTLQEKNITDGVLVRVKELEKEGGLNVPQNYSPANALKEAWLILQETTTSKNDGNRPVLQACTKSSIANCLLDMVIQGLSPAKKQCYFVAYGSSLTLMRSYMGTVAVTKRLKGIKDVKAYCIYEGDEFEETYDYNTATLKITKYVPKFENIDLTKIKGAFAVVIGEDGPVHTEVMNINQIRNAWNQGYAKGNSGAHKNFTDEMAKKTVINRACKMFANTSDDSDLLIGAFNRSDEAPKEDTEQEVHDEIEENANKKIIDIEPDQMKKVEKEPEKQEVKTNSKSETAKKSEQQAMEGPGF